MTDVTYLLMVVTAVEQQWFAPETYGQVVRTERIYGLSGFLFSASNAETAYAMATEWVDQGFLSDANHDGRGDRTVFLTIGIHQLEEVSASKDLASQLREGIPVTRFNLDDVDAQGIPLVRKKEELDLFFDYRRPFI